MDTFTEEKINLDMKQKNVPLLISAIDLKIKNLQKIQKNCVKEKQFPAANDLQYDITLLEGLKKRLIPLKPVPLPLKQ
jgi:hypothetical protein